MPPRIPQTAAIGLFSFTSLLGSLPVVPRSEAFTKCSACLFSTSGPLESIKKKRKKRKVHEHIDPYRAAQLKQREAANLARVKALHEDRLEAMGDPVRSTPTPFVASLSSKQPAAAVTKEHLNFFLKPSELQQSLEYSKWLTAPLPPPSNAIKDPEKQEHLEAERRRRHAEEHENAARALHAIASLENGSSADRTRVNIQRCIDEFGRHNTDQFLPPKPTSTQATRASLDAEAAGITETNGDEDTLLPRRAGPDTGSSEVQAAILTAKINVLADNLHKKDKHNKRNLRVLVHKRQKMLSYLRRKERGGPRWQHLVEKLGIGDAMWKGEISL